MPAWSRSAPVKAPLRWPKSWFSRRSFGMAAQLTARKRLIGCLPWKCKARAISSFPVPLPAQPDVFLKSRSVFENATELGGNFIEHDRFHQVIVGAPLKGLDRILHGR